MWFGPNLAYVHGKRELDTKRFNLPLNAIRVFAFLLNLDLNYKSITVSLCTFTLLLFLGFLPISFV